MAGALGLVLAEADTGRVVAMANAVSDCTLANLQRKATPDAQGRWPALRDSEPCAASRDQRSARMGCERYRQIEADKRAGLNVDRLYGEPVVRDDLAARRLADASIGGGELRGSVFGLAQAWSDLVRQAHGQAPGPRLHLAAGLPSAPTVLGPAPSRRAQQQAQWVLQASPGVTARSAQGTAQGSCCVVFRACPAQGLPGVVGKTGTADFLIDPEGGHFAKPGLQMRV